MASSSGLGAWSSQLVSTYRLYGDSMDGSLGGRSCGLIKTARVRAFPNRTRIIITGVP